MSSIGIVAIVIVALVAACDSAVPTPSPASSASAVPTATIAARPTERPSPTAMAPSATATELPSPSETPGPVVLAQSGAVAAAFFDRANGLVVGAAGTSGVVRRTSDGGRTWGPTITLASGRLVAVATSGTHRAWVSAMCDGESPVGCIGGLFRSDDRGLTWAKISAVSIVSASFVDPSHGWAIGGTIGGAGPSTGGLVATSDGGRTWTRHGASCPVKFGGPSGVSFVSRMHGWVACNYTFGAGGAVKGIVETIDGGKHWTVRSGVSTGDGSVGSTSWSDYLFAFAMRPNGDGLWLGERGTVARTVDAGRRWIAGPPGDFDVDIASSVSLVTDRIWYLVIWLANAQETALERSDDAGVHWSIVAPIGAP